MKVIVSLFISFLLVFSITSISHSDEFVLRDDISAVAPSSFTVEDATMANKLLIDFPNEIPGAAYVDKYITKGAKYCLVHIRQIHLVDGLSEEEKKEVEIVQSDIFKILEYLILNHGLESVYGEGMDPKNAPYANLVYSIESFEESYYDFLKNDILNIKRQIASTEKVIANAYVRNELDGISQLEKSLELLKVQLGEESKELEDMTMSQSESEKYNAIQTIVKKYNIQYFGADIEQVSKEAFEARKDQSVSQEMVRHLVFDVREDVVLWIVSMKKDPLSVVIYGGGHTWGGRESFGELFPINERHFNISAQDNIAVWNRMHLDERFSLIEITPQNYR